MRTMKEFYEFLGWKSLGWVVTEYLMLKGLQA